MFLKCTALEVKCKHDKHVLKLFAHTFALAVSFCCWSAVSLLAQRNPTQLSWTHSLHFIPLDVATCRWQALFYAFALLFMR